MEDVTGNRGEGRPPTFGIVKLGVAAGLICAAALALIFGGAWEQLWELFSDRELIRRFVEGAGFLAPTAYLLLLVLQAVVAPLPAPAVAVAGGHVFGIAEGFFLTWAGALLGGAACFGLSQAFGRRFVSRTGRLDAYAREHGAFAVFVLRLVPLVSFDAVSYVAGLSGIPFWKFLLATALGMAPGTFAFVYLGGSPPGPGLYAVFGALALSSVAAHASYTRRSSPWCSRSG